jgi:hypothetical protein
MSQLPKLRIEFLDSVKAAIADIENKSALWNFTPLQ